MSDETNMAGDTRTIAVIVGAGASLAAGAPGTGELLDTVLATMPVERIFEDLQGNKTADAVPLANLFREHLLKNGDGEAHFEIVMACLEEMISYGMPGHLLQSFTSPRPQFETVLDVGMLQEAYTGAIHALIRMFLARTPKTAQQSNAATSLASFVQRLSSNARIVLSTLNYDSLLDDALPWFDGFAPVQEWDFSEFHPLLWLEHAKDQHLLMHLHGSLRYGFRPFMSGYRGAPFSEPVRYSSSQVAAESVFRSRTSSPSADGLLLPATPIIAGGHKSPKLMHNVRPYAYYNATSLEEIANADALLIIGYGFRDEHVNAWVDEYMRVHPNGPLVLITKRTGRDVAQSSPVERFLMKLSRGGTAYDHIYESVLGGQPSAATHGRFGSAYVATAGVPLGDDVQDSIVSYLANPRRGEQFTDRPEIDMYVGRRAQVLRRDGSTLVGRIKEVGGPRIAVVGKTRAQHIRYEDVIKIEPAPSDLPDTD